jgi:competence protein ComEC
LLGGRLLAWLPRSVTVAPGDTVVLSGTVEAPEAFDGFDYPAYLARQGVGGIARVREARVLPAEGLDPARLAGAVRGWLLHGLNAVIPEPEAALGAGILLGVRSGIAPEIADAFATAGLTHVVAISGWNIAIVAALVAAGVRPLERRPGGRWLSSGAAALAVAGYVVLTGASPSVVRAALMAGAMLVARLGGSRAHAASALALAALVMLLTAPSVLWDVGFQLSALATLGLIWFGTGMEARLAGLPGWLREPVALTLAAQLTTLPVVVANFERLSLVAPLANVVVVPIVPLVMAACAVVAPLGTLDSVVHLPVLSDAALWAAGGTAWLTLRAMVVAGQVAAAVPLASVPVSLPLPLAVAWYPGLWAVTRWAMHRTRVVPKTEVVAARRMGPLAGGWARVREAGAVLMARLSRPRGLAAVLAALLVAGSLPGLPDGRLHLVALDVGQGDAILVRTGSGVTALFDGGPDPELLLRRLGERLPWWQRRIDLVVLTHPHEDHVAGLVAVLERYAVRLVLEPGRDYPNPSYARFRRLAGEEPGGALRAARAGQRLALDERTGLTILYPSEADAGAPLPAGDINNASVVAELLSGSFRALLTGDAEAPVEALLLDRELLHAVDVLKVGHHGSDSSDSLPFLAAVRPRVALISVGAGNDYGHPNPNAMARLAAVPGIQIHRTDREGSIEVVSDGLRFAVQPARPAAGSIAAWPCPPLPTPRRRSPRTPCPTGCSPTSAAWRGWRPRRHGCWRRPAWPSIRTSSRSPPCCTTSTRRTRASRWSTGSWGHAG